MSNAYQGSQILHTRNISRKVKAVNEEHGDNLAGHTSDIPQLVQKARAAAVEYAQDEQAVGEFLERSEVDDNVYDFRFDSQLRGYEHWVWAVSMFHDVEFDEWTINETALLPTSASLVAPQWVPFRERLEPQDINPDDRLGTAKNDERLEEGMSEEADGGQMLDAEHQPLDPADSPDDVKEAVETFRLTRRRVLTGPALQEVAKRWYEGSHGPKSLSTQTAQGHHCDSCAFFIPLSGSLGRYFGVCANRWSPDDGKVVSIDHGCGQHSDIEPEQQEGLWPENQPIYDDQHIDILARTARMDPPAADVIENLEEEDQNTLRDASTD